MKTILYILLALAVLAAIIYLVFFSKHPEDKYTPFNTAYYNLLEANAEEAKYAGPVNASTVGLAISGGGSRALTATLGSYRGLDHLGLMDNANYISSVSGGTWASVLYTFLPSAINDADFLGQSVEDPSTLYWGDESDANPANLNYLTPNNLGNVPGRLGIPQLVETILEQKAEYGYPLSQAWVRAIGKLVLEPYGLSKVYDDEQHPYTYGKPTKYYSLNEETAQAIIDRNPGLSSSDFQLVERKRPFLVANTAMFETHQEGVTMLPVESSALGMGIRSTFPGKGIDDRDIGGGVIPPFAFSGKDQKKLKDGEAQVMLEQRFSLTDITGLSSATFAQGIESTHPEFDDLLPKYYYWPVANMEDTRNQSTVNWFADGGNLENTGVNALLARKVPTIIAFCHGEEEITKKPNGVIYLDYMVCSLFGYMPLGNGDQYILYKDADTIPNDVAGYKNNQVFPSEEFHKVQEGLWEVKKAGLPVMYLQKNLKTVENHYFDVEAGQDVTVLWVYLNRSDKWYEKLSPELQKKLADNAKEFKDFPRYETEKQLHLNAVQVNLLANMNSWNIFQDEYIIPSAGKTSKAMFEELLSN